MILAENNVSVRFANPIYFPCHRFASASRRGFRNRGVVTRYAFGMASRDKTNSCIFGESPSVVMTGRMSGKPSRNLMIIYLLWKMLSYCHD